MQHSIMECCIFLIHLFYQGGHYEHDTTYPQQTALHDFKEYYLTKQSNSRNYTLILMGLNTALRINDILHLTWGNVYCTEHRRFYTHLLITEKKTEKKPGS